MTLNRLSWCQEYVSGKGRKCVQQCDCGDCGLVMINKRLVTHSIFAAYLWGTLACQAMPGRGRARGGG